MAVEQSRHRFGFLNLHMTKYGKDYFKRSYQIVIIVVKSCCRMLVLAVMVTILESSLVVINAVAMVNDHWPVIILSAALCSC